MAPSPARGWASAHGGNLVQAVLDETQDAKQAWRHSSGSSQGQPILVAVQDKGMALLISP